MLGHEQVEPRGARLALWIGVLGYPVVLFTTLLAASGIGDEPALRTLVFGLLHTGLAVGAWTVLRAGSADRVRGPERARVARLSAAGLAGAAGAIGFAGWLGIAVVQTYAAFGAEPPGQAVASAVADAEGWRLGVYLLLAVVLAPVAEELLFRGVLLSRLLLAVGHHRALLLQAVVFGLWHFLADVTLWPLAVPLMAVGWWCGVVRLRTGSIVPAIVAHMLFNAAGVLQLRGIG